MTGWRGQEARAGGRTPSDRAGGLAVAATAVFVLLQLPLLRDVTWRHADEWLYTDAAIGILADGDPVTPRAHDGTPRFHKPLLTYWAIAGSFAAFGIGVGAARLPSLLAVVLLTWLTWRIALVWFEDRVIALLGVVILLANPETAHLATRATPDALLVCALAASLLGVSWLATEPLPPGGATLAWVGAGLGVATKGLPGLLGIAYGFLALARAGRARWLVQPVAMALGAGLAIAGSAPSWLRHGATAMSGLYADQLGTRHILHSLDAVVRSAGHELGSMAIAFLPWTAVLVLRGRATIGAARRHAAASRFTLEWAILLILTSALLAFRRPRYVAPAIPILAVLCAALLVGMARNATPAPAVGHDRVGRHVMPFLALGFAWMLASGLFRGVVRPVLSESAAPAVMACLDASGADGAAAVAVGETAARVASDLRLLSGGLFDLAGVRGPRMHLHRPPPSLLVAGDEEALDLRQAGWNVRPCGREARVPWTFRHVVELVRTRDRERLLAARSRTVYLATRTPQHAGASPSTPIM